MDRTEIHPLYASLSVGEGGLPDQVASLGIPIFRLPEARFRNLYRSAEKIRLLRQMIRSNKVDVVFSNGGHANLFARPAAVWTGRPCVWWCHGYEPLDILRGHAIAIAHQLLAADMILANSEWTARMLRRDFPSSTNIRVVRPGVDCREFRPFPEAGAIVREELGISADEKVVGMFGRLQRWKGQHVFLEAASQLKRNGIHCRFLIVGSSFLGMDEEYAAQLRQQVCQSNLSDAVMLLGERTDISALMNACDVIVHTSIEPEPWGLVVAEAMASGKPVIASRAGGPLEMIEHGKTGILIPPDSPSRLAEALAAFLSKEINPEALGNAAREYAVQHYTHTLAAEKLVLELQRAGNSGRTQSI